MADLQLDARHLDLLRRLDGDQDGRVSAADVQAALSAGWLTLDGNLPLGERVRRRLQRLLARPRRPLRLAYRRRRLRGVQDWAVVARRLRLAMAAHHGLPPVLLTTATARADHGDDPGNYYCEHVFYTAQQLALAPGSTVRRNPHGEPLVGFIHVPPDPACWRAPRGGDPDVRHADTRRILAAALRGLVQACASDLPTDELRLLITGFGPFRQIRDNPTGDCVSLAANLDAVVALAFEQVAPLTLAGGKGAAASARLALSYHVRGPASLRLHLHALSLPVADAALDPDAPGSLPRMMAEIAPHAVIGMGVHSRAPAGDYRIESHADDGNLREGRHVRGSGVRHSLPANYALARAIHAGAEWVMAIPSGGFPASLSG